MNQGLPGVSVCFPAYNEEATIASVLDDAHALLSGAPFEYQILVCNDGSTDGTAAIVDEAARRLPRVRAIHHSRNRGIYETFEHLYAEAAREFIFLNSTDGQWDTRILLEMLPLTADYDVIVASRRDKHYGKRRELVSWVFNCVPRLLFGVSTVDAGAVKLMRREIVVRFPLVSRSPFSEAERLIWAARAGYRITARPVDTRPRQAGTPRGVSLALVARSMLDVLRVWWAVHVEPPSWKMDKQPAESSHADRR